MKKTVKIVIALILGVLVVQVLKKRGLIGNSSELMASAKGGVECMCRDKFGNYNINRCPSSKYTDCDKCCSHFGKISDNEKV